MWSAVQPNHKPAKHLAGRSNVPMGIYPDNIFHFFIVLNPRSALLAMRDLTALDTRFRVRDLKTFGGGFFCAAIAASFAARRRSMSSAVRSSNGATSPLCAPT